MSGGSSNVLTSIIAVQFVNSVNHVDSVNSLKHGATSIFDGIFCVWGGKSILSNRIIRLGAVFLPGRVVVVAI